MQSVELKAIIDEIVETDEVKYPKDFIDHITEKIEHSAATGLENSFYGFVYESRICHGQSHASAVEALRDILHAELFSWFENIVGPLMHDE